MVPYTISYSVNKSLQICRIYRFSPTDRDVKYYGDNTANLLQRERNHVYG